MSNISFLGQEAKPLGLGHMNLWKMHVDQLVPRSLVYRSRAPQDFLA